MNAQDKIKTIVKMIENGDTLIFQTPARVYKVKKTYKVWKDMGPHMFFANADGKNIHIRSGNLSSVILATMKEEK